MAKRGYHQTAEVFSREIIANPNPVDTNNPEGFLIDWWSAFYEAFSSRFPEVSLLVAESFDKVTQTVQNAVSNIGSVNLPDAPSHMGAKISNVMSSSPMMLSLHLIGSSPAVASSSPDLMDTNILDVLSSVNTKSVVPNLSPQRDLTSSLQLLEMSNMDGMLPSASNSGYPMQQNPIVPLHRKARDDKHAVNLGRHLWMEANLCASANILSPCPEPSDAGNNRSLRQASHQGQQLVGVGSVPPLISHQVVLPSEVVPTQKECHQRDAGMLGDTNKITAENLTVDQQIIAPVGEIQQMEISGKQTTAQEPMNQLTLKSSNKVGKDDVDSYSSQADASGYASKKSIASLAEWKGISIKEIDSLHATQSKLLSCHFHSQGKLLATAGERKFCLIKTKRGFFLVKW